MRRYFRRKTQWWNKGIQHHSEYYTGYSHTFATLIFRDIWKLELGWPILLIIIYRYWLITDISKSVYCCPICAELPVKFTVPGHWCYFGQYILLLNSLCQVLITTLERSLQTLCVHQPINRFLKIVISPKIQGSVRIWNILIDINIMVPTKF